MNILFFTHYFPPEVNAPAGRTYENCRRWVKDGHNVTVITGVPNMPAGKVFDGYKNKLYQCETMASIKVIRIWTYIAANKGMLKRTINFISYMVSASIAGLFVKKPTLLIATSPQFFCGWAGAIVRFFKRCPFILEIRDIWPESITTVQAIKSNKTIQFLEWLEHRLYQSATHIVTVGEGYKERLEAKGVSPAKISVNTNGIDTETFFPQDKHPEIRQRWHMGDRFVCAYIGTIGMACGLDVVLRAAGKLKQSGRRDILFLLVGDGATREELEKRAGEEGLDNVVFTGLINKHDIPALMASIDCCLVHLLNKPLFETVLPSKIFEAAAMERPVILGVKGHAEKLVKDAACGVFMEPENDDELVREVTLLADHPDERKRLGEQGACYMAQHYNRDQLAKHYLDIIQTVLEHKGTS